MNDSLKIHAQAIVNELEELAGKSVNFTNVAEYLAGKFFNVSGPHVDSDYLLSWQECPLDVLGAVLSIGMFLQVPKDVLMSDELLPTIAAILRRE